MKVQAITKQVYTKRQSNFSQNSKTDISNNLQKNNVSFKGIGGIIQGGVKGTMVGLLGGALAAASLPVLLGAAAVGALAGAAIDNKLEDIANKDKDKKDR